MRKVLAITTFITLALVLFPSAFVNAQSGRTPTSIVTCTNTSSGAVTVSSGSDCPAGTTAKTVAFQTYNTTAGTAYVRAICTYRQENRFSNDTPTQYEWHTATTGAGLDATGKFYSCASIPLNTPVTNGVITSKILERGAYIFSGSTLSAISLQPNGIAKVGPVTQTTPTTPGTSTPGAPTGNQKPVTPGTSTTSPTQGNQECDANFKKVGPLCIPDSPITDPNSIANSGSIGELATNIIRILLYVAGIIAVVFVIIGGYYVMTAGGNDTQAAAGRKTLTNALIGLVIVILAFTIVQAITGFILNG